MRRLRSLILLLPALFQISCQASKAPVTPVTQVKIAGSVTDPAGLTPPGPAQMSPPAQTQQVASPGKSAADPGKADKKEKKSPIPPIIGSVQTGLLAPESQVLPSGVPLPENERQRIVYNFDKADIAEVTSQIFGDQLKAGYVLDQTLQGQLSMYIEGEFDTRELLQVITRAYEANGVSVVPKNGFYNIMPSNKTMGGALPIAGALLLKGGIQGVNPLVVIYRLRYMDPKQASNLIAPFLSQGKKSVTEPLTNSLIFVEGAENARSIVNILKTVDINILQEISTEIVPLRSIAPQDAVQAMESLMGKLGGFKESALKSSLAFLPLQNLPGVLVMAQNPELLGSAKQWLQAIDVQGAGSVEEINIYFVQNGLARDIADILNSVYGLSSQPDSRKQQQIVPSGKTATRSSSGVSSSGSSLGSGSSGSAFGSSRSKLSGSSTTGTGGSSTGQTGSRTTGAGGATAGATGAGVKASGNGILSGEVMIIPDEINNAIVIRANAIDYAKIRKTLETLDILPRAVFIEVVIAEVQLIKDFEYGLQYWFQSNAANQKGFGVSFGGLSNSSTTTTSTSSSSTTTTSAFPDIGTLAGNGVALSWIAGAQNMAVFLNALSSKTNVNVLSTPTLLAMDNKEATITVGGREPVPTGSYTSSSSTTSAFSTIEYEDTGIILNIIPHINAGGLVRLELEQVIRRVNSETVVVGANNTAPSFTERNVKTTVLAQSGSTVVIGGIIESSRNDTKNGIPFLQDVPLLSPLFASTSKSLNRTELIVAIKPVVIDQRGGGASNEFLLRMKSLMPVSAGK
ncbi:MAG: type II secretion system secretin GspD [Syntrophobacteraceae bacterium]